MATSERFEFPEGPASKFFEARARRDYRRSQIPRSRRTDAGNIVVGLVLVVGLVVLALFAFFVL